MAVLDPDAFRIRPALPTRGGGPGDPSKFLPAELDCVRWVLASDIAVGSRAWHNRPPFRVRALIRNDELALGWLQRPQEPVDPMMPELPWAAFRRGNSRAEAHADDWLRYAGRFLADHYALVKSQPGRLRDVRDADFDGFRKALTGINVYGTSSADHLAEMDRIALLAAFDQAGVAKPIVESVRLATIVNLPGVHGFQAACSLVVGRPTPISSVGLFPWDALWGVAGAVAVLVRQPHPDVPA